MEKQFVTYGIALELEKLGFNEEVLAYISRETEETFIVGNLISEKQVNKYFHRLKRPLWQQALDWLKNTCNLEIEVFKSAIHFYKGDVLLPPKYQFIIDVPFVYTDEYLYHSVDEDGHYETSEEAREAAILKAIKLKNE